MTTLVKKFKFFTREPYTIKMNNQVKTFLSAFILLLLCGCRDIHCPAFPERLLAYMPYEKGDFLKFKNLDNVTLAFKIKDTYASGPSSFDWNCKCACISDAGFETEINDLYSLRISSSTLILSKPYLASIGFSFYDANSKSDGFAMEVKGNPYLNESNSFFGDSIVLNEEENERISKVIIVKGKGIVEFFDKKENCTWVKIE